METRDLITVLKLSGDVVRDTEQRLAEALSMLQRSRDAVRAREMELIQFGIDRVNTLVAPRGWSCFLARRDGTIAWRNVTHLHTLAVAEGLRGWEWSLPDGRIGSEFFPDAATTLAAMLTVLDQEAYGEGDDPSLTTDEVQP